ncbi:MAG: ROK family protein [Patescibacteria group bacterium]
MTYVLFDIGGTNTRVTVSEDLTKFGEIKKFKTSGDYKKGVKAIVDAAHELLDGKPVEGAAGGIRGILNEDKTGLDKDSILDSWAEKPLADDLCKGLKCKDGVYLENDTAIIGLGEYHFGAGEHADIMVYHTVSTGVGGAKIESGEVDVAAFGFEPGHQILDIDRTVLGEDVPPTLENLVSGAAVKRRMGTEPYEIPQSDLIWDELAGYLAQGLRNTIMYWSPEVIVLGGSMIVGDPRILLDDIRKHTNEALDGFVPTPLIVDAKLGDDGGLYGAMVLLQHRLGQD